MVRHHMLLNVHGVGAEVRYVGIEGGERMLGCRWFSVIWVRFGKRLQGRNLHDLNMHMTGCIVNEVPPWMFAKQIHPLSILIEVGKFHDAPRADQSVRLVGGHRCPVRRRLQFLWLALCKRATYAHESDTEIKKETVHAPSGELSARVYCEDGAWSQCFSHDRYRSILARRTMAFCTFNWALGAGTVPTVPFTEMTARENESR